MSQYLLKISGSNEIESIFEWDGSGSLTPPPEYEIELLTNSELEYISYIDITQQTSSIDESQNLSVGLHYGMFSGNIISSTINGLSLGYHINATEYGQLSEVHKDSLTENSYISQSWFSVIDDNTIMLSDTNGSYRYENILSEIIKNNEKNYVLSLIRDTIGSETAEFIVKNTEQIENGIYSMYQLTVDNINYISSSLFNATFIQNEKIPWNIDFKFNTSNDISSEYTGSFTGSFEGYAELTGSFFGAFEGILDGTASNAIYALTASFAQNASTVDIITKSKNWTKPSWAKTIRVTCVGGGGGGGAAPALEDTMSLTIGGGGGGGGTITVGEFDADTLPNTISITVGAGGFGGIHDGVSLIGPSNGGDTYFGRYLIARGGNRGFNGGTEIAYAYGGSTIANIHYLNTGAGGGGAGTVDGYIGSPLFITDASEAPPLPLPNQYVSTGGGGTSYYIVAPTPIPSVIAPTGGGGGLGYDFQNGGRQDGITKGGSISAYGLTNQDNRFQSLSPFEYSSGSYEIIDSESIDLSTYPAYNTTVGLGGRGGNPYYIDIDLSSAMPTDGTIYGGGGGGAFGGGIDGRYINGEINGTPYNFGANGAQGVVVIISEA